MITMILKSFLLLKRPMKYIKHRSFRKELYIYDSCYHSYFELINTVTNDSTKNRVYSN